MPIAQVNTFGRLGLRSFPIVVEVDVSPGLPSFTIVGLPDATVQESRERIRSAIRNTGASFPLARITVNLAPGDVRKEGVGFDLPIALGILIASEQLSPLSARSYCFGELGLEGELKLTRGTLSFVRSAKEADAVYIPLANRYEAGLIQDTHHIYGVQTLKELLYILKGEIAPSPVNTTNLSQLSETEPEYDFKYIHGQSVAKRALEIAAAGHHNVMLSGPPGAGKTLLARSLPSIMPPLSQDEIIETTEIYSVAGVLRENAPYVASRPFRSPHHSSSLVSVVGGSNPPRPGEITLAHNGVLFIDEFAELPRNIIESLRQPLEDRVITVSRAGCSAVFPAHCLLIAAINPCPCGYRDDPRHTCVCTPQQIAHYQKKLSGPIIDRIDMHITVPPVRVTEFSENEEAESSHTILKRVIKARAHQQERYQDLSIRTNSELLNRHIPTCGHLSEEAKKLLDEAVDKMNLSARAYYKVIKLARTIADLKDSDKIKVDDIAEALHYRPLQIS